jgi:hypothetical protein
MTNCNKSHIINHLSVIQLGKHSMYIETCVFGGGGLYNEWWIDSKPQSKHVCYSCFGFFKQKGFIVFKSNNGLVWEHSINHTILRLLCVYAMRENMENTPLRVKTAGSGKYCEYESESRNKGRVARDCLCYIQNKLFLISCVPFLTKWKFNA